MDIGALHDRSVITTDDRLLIPANDINWRGYAGTVYEHVRVGEPSVRQDSGVGVIQRLESQVVGEALSALCVITRGCRQSAHWCFYLPASWVASWIKVGLAPNGHIKHMLMSARSHGRGCPLELDETDD